MITLRNALTKYLLMRACACGLKLYRQVSSSTFCEIRRTKLFTGHTTALLSHLSGNNYETVNNGTWLLDGLKKKQVLALRACIVYQADVRQ